MSDPFDGVDLSGANLSALSTEQIGGLFAHVPDEEVDRVVAALKVATAKEASNRQVLSDALATLKTVGGIVLTVAAVG